MDGAEVYLLMIRKSGLPILGEAMAPPFNQQVEVLDWNWKIVNQEEVDQRDKDRRENTELAAKTDKEVKLEIDVLAEDESAAKRATRPLTRPPTRSRRSSRTRQRRTQVNPRDSAKDRRHPERFGEKEHKRGPEQGQEGDG